MTLHYGSVAYNVDNYLHIEGVSLGGRKGILKTTTNMEKIMM